MAKIDSYVTVTPPVAGGDMLIGTDVTDNNATKNFTVSQLLTYIESTDTFAPYTGATQDLDLGSNGIITGFIENNGEFKSSGSAGNFGDVLVSQGSGVAPEWQSSQGEVINVKKSLTSSDILSLGTSPFTLVDAIPGKIIIPLSIVIDFKYISPAYFATGGINVSNGNTLYMISATNIITAAFDSSYWISGIQGIQSFSPASFGLPLQALINGGTNPTGGNGTMDVYVTYTTIG